MPGNSKPYVSRSVPFVVSAAGSATPLTYNAEQNPTPHTYKLAAKSGNFQIDDGSNRAFIQAMADTGAININADPRGSDSSLTIDFSTGSFANAIFFDGGTGTGVHTLSFVAAGAFSVVHTSPTSGIVTLGAQTVTFKNVTSLLAGTPVTVQPWTPDPTI